MKFEVPFWYSLSRQRTISRVRPYDARPSLPGASSTREPERAMNLSFEQTLVTIRRQVLVENAKVVELGTERCSVSAHSQARFGDSPTRVDDERSVQLGSGSCCPSHGGQRGC